MRLSREEAVRPWINRGLIDLFMGFKQSSLIPLYLFFLEQGIEKLSKAYLLAAQSNRYEALEYNEATNWVDSYSRRFLHNLSDILGEVSIGIPDLRNLVVDPFISLLEKASEEGRYPKPPKKSIFEEHGLAAVVSSRNEEKTFLLAKQILSALEKEFGIQVDLTRPPHPGIDIPDWQRFLAIFIQGTRDVAAIKVARNNEKVKEVIAAVIRESRASGILKTDT